MRDNYEILSEEAKAFIIKNGEDMTVQEMADHFYYSLSKMRNILWRNGLPYKRHLSLKKRLELKGPEPEPEPTTRERGVYDNTPSPYGIYSSTLNIKLRCQLQS